VSRVKSYEICMWVDIKNTRLRNPAERGCGTSTMKKFAIA
jgi:hypothetical protein